MPKLRHKKGKFRLAPLRDVITQCAEALHKAISKQNPDCDLDLIEDQLRHLVLLHGTGGASQGAAEDSSNDNSAGGNKEVAANTLEVYNLAGDLLTLAHQAYVDRRFKEAFSLFQAGVESEDAAELFAGISQMNASTSIAIEAASMDEIDDGEEGDTEGDEGDHEFRSSADDDDGDGDENVEGEDDGADTDDGDISTDDGDPDDEDDSESESDKAMMAALAELEGDDGDGDGSGEEDTTDDNGGDPDDDEDNDAGTDIGAPSSSEVSASDEDETDDEDHDDPDVPMSTVSTKPDVIRNPASKTQTQPDNVTTSAVARRKAMAAARKVSLSGTPESVAKARELLQAATRRRA